MDDQGGLWPRYLVAASVSSLILNELFHKAACSFAIITTVGEDFQVSWSERVSSLPFHLGRVLGNAFRGNPVPSSAYVAKSRLGVNGGFPHALQNRLIRRAFRK